MKAIIDIENLKRGRKGRELEVIGTLKSEVLLTGIAKDDHKEGGDYFSHGRKPTQIINK